MGHEGHYAEGTAGTGVEVNVLFVGLVSSQMAMQWREHSESTDLSLTSNNKKPLPRHGLERWLNG